LLEYTEKAAVPFQKEWPTQLSYAFDLKEAKRLLAKKEEDEEE
jgi:hypothetical protein